jgi:hypothetical protein
MNSFPNRFTQLRQSPMSTALTHYCVVKSIRSLTATNAVTVQVRKELFWDSSSPKSRNQRFVFVVGGTIKEKDKEYPVTWEFVWPDDGVTAIEQGLLPIQEHVNTKQFLPQGSSDLEIHTDAKDWLRIGWKDERDGKFYGYAEFSKDGLRLRARTENYPSLEVLRSMLLS